MYIRMPFNYSIVYVSISVIRLLMNGKMCYHLCKVKNNRQMYKNM